MRCMVNHMSRRLIRRSGFFGAALLAVAGVLLLVFGSQAVDQAELFAAIAFLCSAFAVYFAGALPDVADTSRDLFENVAWGRLVVALVYASLAVVCFAAMVQAPDFGRFVHAVRAIV